MANTHGEVWTKPGNPDSLMFEVRDGTVLITYALWAEILEDLGWRRES